jgi:hypothetical protein
MKAQYSRLYAYNVSILWSCETSPALEPPVIVAEAPNQQIGSATTENDGIIVSRLRMTRSVMFPARRIIRRCVRICRI